MSITSRVLTAEEAREKANGIGLDSVSWDGSLFSLKLEDGTCIEIKSVSGGLLGGSPLLSFNHRLLVIPSLKEKY